MKRIIAALSVAAPALGLAAPSPSPAPAVSTSAPTTTVPLDYGTLSHTIRVSSLRAGSHDESGVNDYYFTVMLHALLNSSEERNAAFTARKKLTVDRGLFGETKIDSLAVWRPDEKLKEFKGHQIDGDAIRELAARAMTELKVAEADLCVMVEIAMFERNKRFFFFGEDTAVGKATYYPIPPTKFDAPLRADQDLVVADDRGTEVKLSVKY